jgi:hypothetical protein
VTSSAKDKGRVFMIKEGESSKAPRGARSLNEAQPAAWRAPKGGAWGATADHSCRQPRKSTRGGTGWVFAEARGRLGRALALAVAITAAAITAAAGLGVGGCSGREGGGAAGKAEGMKALGWWDAWEARKGAHMPAGDALTAGAWQGTARWEGDWAGSARAKRGGFSLPRGLATTGNVEGAAVGVWADGALQSVTWEALAAQGNASFIGEVSWQGVTPGARWERATQRVGAADDPTQGFIGAHEALAAALPALGGDWQGGEGGARLIPLQALGPLAEQAPLRALAALEPVRVTLGAVEPHRVGLRMRWEAQARGGLWVAGALLEDVHLHAEADLWLRRADGLPDAFTLDVSARGTAHEGGFDLSFDASATLHIGWEWTQTQTGPQR